MRRLTEGIGDLPVLRLDIDWGERTIAVTGKGDKKDAIPLSTELRDIL